MFFGLHRGGFSTLLIISTLGAATIPTVGAAQQPLQPLFRIDVGSYDWFANDSTTRSMGFVPGGNLLVPDRGDKNTIYRLDPETGKVIGEMNTTGISSGTYALNRIAVADDGKIYVGNLVTGNDTFKLYYYNDEEAEPVLIGTFEAGAGYRMGDGLAATGKGASTQVLVTGSENKDILIFSDRNGDGTFEARVLTPTNPTLTGVQEALWGPGGATFWLRQPSRERTAAREYRTSDAAGTGRTFGRFANYGSIDAVFAEDKFIAAVCPGYFGDGHLDLPGIIFTEMGDAPPAYATSAGLEKQGGANANLNATSGTILDLENSRVYFLVPNNSISAWKLPDGL